MEVKIEKLKPWKDPANEICDFTCLFGHQKSYDDGVDCAFWYYLGNISSHNFLNVFVSIKIHQPCLLDKLFIIAANLRIFNPIF